MCTGRLLAGLLAARTAGMGAAQAGLCPYFCLPGLQSRLSSSSGAHRDFRASAALPELRRRRLDARARRERHATGDS